MLLIFLSGCSQPWDGLCMKLPLWLRSSPPSHMPSTLVLRFIPVLKLPGPPGLPSAIPTPPEPLGLADPAEIDEPLCLVTACREQEPTHTGSQELSTAARLATGPLAVAAAPEAAGTALPESLLELEPELELEGLRLSRELENFHWGIFGISMQKVVTPSRSLSGPGESASASAWACGGGGRVAGSRGGRVKPGADEGATGVATTTFPLMAKLCIRSSEEVTESLRKRPYLGLSSMPGEAARSRGGSQDEEGKGEGERGEKRKTQQGKKWKSTRILWEEKPPLWNWCSAVINPPICTAHSPSLLPSAPSHCRPAPLEWLNYSPPTSLFFSW